LLPLALITISAPLSFAEEAITPTQPEAVKSLEAVEILTGFSWSRLMESRNYDAFPIMVAFDFDLRPLTKKINLNPASLLQFQIEPFLTSIARPRSNVEAGIGFALKIGLLPQTSKIQPYLKGGVGFDYMSLHTWEQSTQFNFIEYGGGGIHYFFQKNLALTLEWRRRHLSNAGMRKPNHGINTDFALAGLTYNF